MGPVARLAAALFVCATAFGGVGGVRSADARTIELPVTSSAGAPEGVAVGAGAQRAIVRFAASASSSERAAAIAHVGATIETEIPALGATRIALRLSASDPSGDAAGLTVLQLARDPAIASAQLDARAAVAFTPNDSLFAADPSFGLGQWGLRAAHVDQAWDVVRGSPSVIVAVIDTGVDPNHPDLAGTLLPGVTFVSSADPSCPAGATNDDNGHGTHVAGLIAANANNGIGIAGAAFGVRVVPVKALDCTGAGLLSDVAQGVVWATDHGARIINISLGADADVSVLHDAIRYAISHNVLVVAAAGNCGVASVRCAAVNGPQYPAAYPETLAVAATGAGDQHATFSNIDPYVGISAPGVTIWSTTPTYPTTLSRANPGTQTYAAFSGTSQASPLVAAIAALVLSQEPGLSVAQLIDRLHRTADDLGAVGVDPVFGSGRVNALRAVISAPVRYGAQYDVPAPPAHATIGAPIAAPVKLTNSSSFAWPASGTAAVRLGYHWLDLAGNVVVWDGQRSALPTDVPIGGAVTVPVTIPTPAKPGTYVLQIDLVREGVTWFSAAGVVPARLTVGVTSGLAATYAPVASTQSTFVLGGNSFPVTVTNTGTATWPAGGLTPVHLSYHWLDPTGQLVIWDGNRAALASDIAPGQSAVVAITVASPPGVGPYRLRLDLVQEGVTWFSAQGVTPREIAISVTTGFGASYTVTPAATAFLPGSRAVLAVTLMNTGLLPWSAQGSAPVHAAAHVLDLTGHVLVWDGERAALPNDVGPGQSVTLNVAVAIPLNAAPATYDVNVDLVREGIAWFSSSGVVPGSATVATSADYRASTVTTGTSVSRSTPAVLATVTNTSVVPWLLGGAAPIDVGSHWLAADGTALVWDGPRVPLGQIVAPGGSVTLTIPLAQPPVGASRLVVDLVAEGSRWFGSGSPIAVTLVP